MFAERGSTKNTITQIKNDHHHLAIIKSEKISLTAFDTKRYICADGITTKPYGHYSITTIELPDELNRSISTAAESADIESTSTESAPDESQNIVQENLSFIKRCFRRVSQIVYSLFTRIWHNL